MIAPRRDSPPATLIEAELMLACARTRLDAEAAGRARDLLESGAVDWDRLLRLARPHGVMPLLHRSLAGDLGAPVPAAILAGLRERRRANLSRNLMFAGELAALIGLLEAEGIAAMPLKGPALAVGVYGDLSLREFLDLDILVPAASAQRAGAVLVRRGYLPVDAPPPGLEDLYLRSLCARGFIGSAPGAGRGVAVEIHWGIAPRHLAFALGPDRLWERAGTVLLGRRALAAPAPDDLLLLLALHAGKHLWERLEWICDLAELVRVRPDLDWDRAARGARAMGLARMLRCGLLLAEELLDAPVPEKALAEARSDRTAAAIADMIAEGYRTGGPGRPGPLAGNFLRLRARERVSDRLRCALLLATDPSPADWAVLPLPRPLLPLYPLLRLARLTVKHGRGLLARNR